MVQVGWLYTKTGLYGFKAKLHVRIICMGPSSPYRALVRKHFPDARTVADRFHVIPHVK